MYRLVMRGSFIVAMALVSLAVHSAEPIKARDRVEVPDTPQAVWEKYGDFCAIADWHPAVTQCQISEEGGETFRILTLGDGAILKEKHLGQGQVETSYRYSIVEGPLPVENYVATFEVKDDDDGAGIKWFAEFSAKGVDDAEAEKLIEGIFESGLESIEAQY